MKDLIYALKEFPDKWILFTLCILIGSLYVYSPTDFSSQLLNSAISGLMGLLIGRSRNETKIEAGIVQTPAINNDQMNDATINFPNDSTEVKNKDIKI